MFARSADGQQYAARVVATETDARTHKVTRVNVHYPGWKRAHDEWLPASAISLESDATRRRREATLKAGRARVGEKVLRTFPGRGRGARPVTVVGTVTKFAPARGDDPPLWHARPDSAELWFTARTRRISQLRP